MASPLNRPAIFLNLAAFVVVSLFCISTEAPIMQQDILLRCQDALLIHRISIRGLIVSGRDVTLSGAPQSAIISSNARKAVESVNGVRVVTIRVSNNAPVETGSDLGTDSEVIIQTVGQTSNESQKREVQEKIDRLLEIQGIGFNAGEIALTPESKLALDKVAAYLLATSSLQCEIRGYDSEPAENRQDWVLALQRALATEDYLETKGISDWRLSTHTFHVGDGTEGRRTDRLVDLIVRTRE